MLRGRLEIVSTLAGLLMLICALLISDGVTGNFDHLEYNNSEYFGLRVCPEGHRHDFCDIKRDIIWRLKRNGYLWGSRCRSNLRKVNETICGAVLKGSYDVCHEGDPDENQANCHLDCQILSVNASGDCTIGNKPRERCICYSNVTEDENATTKQKPRTTSSSTSTTSSGVTTTVTSV